jgi:hypothetical protein|tara:strand:- start:119 stop:316 length:198 start_codon:yes stop_codon:yes gene_type:complete
MDNKENEQQRLKNKVDDIERLYIPVIKELKQAMRKARKLGFLGLLIGGASLAVSGYLALRLWDKW